MNSFSEVKPRTMKFFKESVFVLMFGIMIFSVSAADESICTADRYWDFPMEQLHQKAFEENTFNNPAADNEVSIVYLLDKDGTPYIISILSEDKVVSQMVRDMMQEQSTVDPMLVPALAEETLGVTFYYNNIR